MSRSLNTEAFKKIYYILAIANSHYSIANKWLSFLQGSSDYILRSRICLLSSLAMSIPAKYRMDIEKTPRGLSTWRRLARIYYFRPYLLFLKIGLIGFCPKPPYYTCITHCPLPKFSQNPNQNDKGEILHRRKFPPPEIHPPHRAKHPQALKDHTSIHFTVPPTTLATARAVLKIRHDPSSERYTQVYSLDFRRFSGPRLNGTLTNPPPCEPASAAAGDTRRGNLGRSFPRESSLGPDERRGFFPLPLRE